MALVVTYLSGIFFNRGDSPQTNVDTGHSFSGTYSQAPGYQSFCNDPNVKNVAIARSINENNTECDWSVAIVRSKMWRELSLEQQKAWIDQ